MELLIVEYIQYTACVRHFTCKSITLRAEWPLRAKPQGWQELNINKYSLTRNCHVSATMLDLGYISNKGIQRISIE